MNLPSTWLDTLSNMLFGFLRSADVHTVIAITALSTLLKFSLWRHWGLSGAYLAWVPLAFSFLLTPVMSAAEEVQWGGRFFIKAAIYNGITAELAFHFLLPYCQRRWPQVFTLMKAEVDKEGRTGGFEP